MTTPALSLEVRGKGRHYRVDDDGTLAPSVTNITGLIKDATPLMYWAGEGVATWICDHPDDWHSMVIDDPDGAIAKLKGIWRESRDEAADAGTKIHNWLEAAVAFGKHSDEAAAAEEALSPKARPFLPAAQEFVFVRTPAGITEETLIGDGYAGTADLIGTIGGGYPPGVVDYKTRKKHAIYDGDVLQLAALRACKFRAELLDDETVRVDPIEPIKHAYLVTFTPDSYRIHDLTAHTGPKAYEAFMGLRVARIWQTSKKNPSIKGIK